MGSADCTFCRSAEREATTSRFPQRIVDVVTVLAQKVKAGAKPQAQQLKSKSMKSYFDELIGRRVEVLTKYAEDGSYHIYRGVFLGLEKGYLWLENCEVVTVKKDGTIVSDSHIYPRVALNEAIVAQVRLS